MTLQNFLVVDKKYLVTKLLKCNNCNLQYRFPVDDTSFNENFYQEDYEESGLTTDLPSDVELNRLIEVNFKNSEKDFSRHINSIMKLTKGVEKIKFLDFGANWGYATFQFLKVGFDVEAYEISRSRAKFAEKFGVNIKTELKEISKGKDVFFSAHVIEHHPRVSDMFSFAKSVLNENGIMITYCPNGSKEFREYKPNEFHSFWGYVHPNYIGREFIETVFKNNPYAIGSNLSEKEMIESWDGKSQQVYDLKGSELVFFVKPNTKI